MTDYENGFEECSEAKAMFLEDAAAELDDRAAFVRNCGRLAAQTREGVKSIELIPGIDHENEYAEITYKNDYKKLVNIECCSYTAIVREIFRHIS